MREQNFFGVRINSEKLHEAAATICPAAVSVNNCAEILTFFPDVAIRVDHGSEKHHVRTPSPVAMGDVPLVLLGLVSSPPSRAQVRDAADGWAARAATQASVG